MGYRFRLVASALALCAALGAVLIAPPAGSASGASRTYTEDLSPAPGDIAVLAIRFPRAGRHAIDSRTLDLAALGAFGDDYLAAAVPRTRAARGGPVLVLVANRASALLDPSFVRLRLRAARGLGVARTVRRIDPFSYPAGAQAKLCTLTHGPAALAPAALRVLAFRGPALTGLTNAAAIAAAYDAACALPYPVALVRAVGNGEAGCPAGSSCVPAPVPPPVPVTSPPEPPRCAPCDPRPGVACPLEARAAYCVAAEDGVAASAVPGAH